MLSSETINKDTCNGNFMRYDSLELTPGQKVAHAHIILCSTEQGHLSPGMLKPMYRWACSLQGCMPTGEEKRRITAK